MLPHKSYVCLWCSATLDVIIKQTNRSIAAVNQSILITLTNYKIPCEIKYYEHFLPFILLLCNVKLKNNIVMWKINTLRNLFAVIRIKPGPKSQSPVLSWAIPSTFHPSSTTSCTLYLNSMKAISDRYKNMHKIVPRLTERALLEIYDSTYRIIHLISLAILPNHYFHNFSTTNTHV